MTYSMVNMPVLGFDLCRLPRGAEVADVLLAAMLLDHGGVARLGVAGSRPVPSVPAWADVEQVSAPATRTDHQLHRLETTLAAAEPGEIRAVVDMLERSTLGSLESLVRLVRDELFAARLLGYAESVPVARTMRAPHVAAIDVVADAVSAAYPPQALPATTRRELRRRWESAGVQAPDHSTIDLGPQSLQLRAVLRAVADLGPTQVRALRMAVDADSSRRRSWALAMHEASWAVHVTERAIPAALAQLLTVLAFDRSPFTGQDANYGVWNAISGLVQSIVVEDILDDEVLASLQDFWVHAMRAALD